MQRPKFIPTLFSLLAGLLVYTTSIVQYSAFNSNGLLCLFHAEATNPLLTNSVNKYHPFIFYCMTLSFVYKYQLGVSYVKTYKSELIIRYGAENHLIYTVITLALGGWWALQEGSWGGWWNWDPSETFGLVLLLVFLYYTHVLNSHTHSVRGVKVIWVSSAVFIALYLFIQLNFDLVSHNFGTRTHQFVNSYYSYLLGLVIVGLFTYINFTKLSSFNFVFTRTNLVKPKNLLLYSLICLSLLLVVASLVDLVINFVWLLLGLNVLNTTPDLIYYVLIVVLVVLLITYSCSIFKLCVLVPLVFLNYSTKIVLLTLVGYAFLKTSHRVIVLWLLLSLTYVNRQVSGWALSDVNLGLTSQMYTNLKLNSSYLECSSSEFINNYLVEGVWGFIKSTTTTLNQSFKHQAFVGYSTQSLSPHYFEHLHSISVIDGGTVSLMFLLVVWVKSTQQARHQQQIIIF